MTVLKWLPEWLVCFVGTIYFLCCLWTYGMYPHEMATLRALRKRGLVPRENTRVHIDGWVKRPDDDFNTLLTHDIFDYKMPHALFFDPDKPSGCDLTVSLSVCTTADRNAEIAKQRVIEQKLDVLLHATPPHSELYRSRQAELDALCAARKDVYTTVSLAVPAGTSTTDALLNCAEQDVFFARNLSGYYFKKEN